MKAGETFLNLRDLQIIGDTLRKFNLDGPIVDHMMLDFDPQLNTIGQRRRALKTYRMIYGSFQYVAQ